MHCRSMHVTMTTLAQHQYLYQYFPTRVPQTIVNSWAKNRGTNKKFGIRPKKKSKYVAKYGGKFCPSIGNTALPTAFKVTCSRTVCLYRTVWPVWSVATERLQATNILWRVMLSQKEVPYGIANYFGGSSMGQKKLGNDSLWMSSHNYLHALGVRKFTLTKNYIITKIINSVYN